MARSNSWKTIFLSTSMCASWCGNCWPFCHPYPHSPYDGYNPSQFAALWLFLCHYRNYLTLGHRKYVSTCTYLSCTAIKSSLVLMQMSPLFSFVDFGASSCGMLSCLAWQCHNSKSVSSRSLQIIREENKLSMYNLWLCPIFLISFVTVTWVAVTCCTVRCVSFPRNIFTSYM